MTPRIKLFLNKISIYTVLITTPLFVFAAPQNLTQFINLLTSLLLKVIPVIFALALLAVLWAGSKLILYADNETERTENKSMLIWGIVTLFVMISIWGLVNLLKNTFFP